VGEATSKETIEQLRNKVAKFQALKAEAEAKNKAKMLQASKTIGFGFPNNSLSALRLPTQPVRNDKVHIKLTEP
jgi:SpoVK/Ycf46/Vps4 family AAA+-type ATPase